jgi:hypothetical protein
MMIECLTAIVRRRQSDCLTALFVHYGTLFWASAWKRTCTLPRMVRASDEAAAIVLHVVGLPPSVCAKANDVNGRY